MKVSAKLRESILVGSQNSAVCVFCCFCIVWLREGGWWQLSVDATLLGWYAGNLRRIVTGVM